MQVEVINSVDKFLSYEKDWIDLVDNCHYSSPYSNFHWLVSILKAESISNLSVIIVKDKSNVILAAFPMVVRSESIFGVQRLFLTHLCYKYSDYSELLIRDGLASKNFIKKICTQIYLIANDVDFLKIDNLNSSQRVSRLFLKYLREGDSLKCLYPNVSNPIYFYTQNHEVNKKRVKECRRKLQKLSEQYEVEMKISTEPVFESSEWKALVKFHKMSFPSIGFNSNQKFYEILLSSDFPKKSLEFSYMKINNKIVACHFGLRCNKTIYYYIPSFDKDYRSDSVGMVLLNEMIEYYGKKGFNEFNFLRGAEVYKNDFISDDSLNYTFISLGKRSIVNATLLYGYSIAKQLPYKGRRD
ncbi:GNAT family N-acetyltransferase [Vibrio sp. F12]|uniref:GNAT family N-acetyltransferase n=1 Tax=Vibrio sp. F12 TaxID=2070776 RepID=UPI0010BD169D|nr:GNAT family N-acetyltransferase [Vibrio sp. F12]TKE90503.1 GNAT family N-acetyltransferase [Vibrio sp. F12]